MSYKITVVIFTICTLRRITSLHLGTMFIGTTLVNEVDCHGQTLYTNFCFCIKNLLLKGFYIKVTNRYCTPISKSLKNKKRDKTLGTL